MPQMSPLSWMTVSLLSVFVFFFFTIKMSYTFSSISVTPYLNTCAIFNWKW